MLLIGSTLAAKLFYSALCKQYLKFVPFSGFGHRSRQRKYSLGRPDQRDLSENLAATQGLSHMVTECSRLFQVQSTMCIEFSANDYQHPSCMQSEHAYSSQWGFFLIPGVKQGEKSSKPGVGKINMLTSEFNSNK